MDYTPDVKEGDIVFFPSQLLHYANPNTHDKERVILSFNMMGINEIDIYQMKLNETN
jgi:ectoine hydroxylase-related dioxygenase (phytanoyl-CoA dioxygenase family)